MYCKHGSGNAGCVPCAIEAQTEVLKKELEAIRKEIAAQQSVNQIGLLARIGRWFGAIANR